MTASRKQLRADLKAYFSPLITALQSEDDFYKYEPADYKSRSPIVFLNSGGAAHPAHTKALDSEFLINVHLLALYADLNGGIYNEEAASNLLDDMEQQLSAAVEAKRTYPGKWQFIGFEGDSQADEPQQVGGDLYLHEVVTLRVRMY
ncbi:MAG: hypothetical protein PHQ36_05840 [Anaerolineales bacterium]|nr:hypothetical protein [Anaerolineales bacterium]